MAGLEGLWSHFFLTEEEEQGTEVDRHDEVQTHRLAGRFFTKRVLNIESVGRIFKPLWKLIGELKIRDIGNNILLFEFTDNLDLERVLEFEPWMFDKSLVVFQRATSIEEVPLLDFSRSPFWVQFHNVPENSMNQATGDSIGSSIGTVIQVADREDDSAGGEFLRVRISIDLSKPLS